MDKDFELLIKDHERLYKFLERYKYDPNIDKMFIPNIDDNIKLYYQKKLDNELKKDDNNDEKKTEEIKNKIDEEAKFNLENNDEWLIGIKNKHRKLKKIQKERREEILEDKKGIRNTIIKNKI